MATTHGLFHSVAATAFCVLASLLLPGSNPVDAQEVADTPAPKKENDGTDPTSPVRFLELSYEHLDLSLPESVSGNNSNTFAMEFQQPFGRTAFRFKLPVTSLDALGDSSFGLGDVSAKVSQVASVTKTHGIVIGAEMIFNTASLVGFGGLIAALPAFAILSDAVLAASGGDPLISVAAAVAALSGITGSASGGMSIALDSLAPTFVQMAQTAGVSMEAMHRVASVASGALDALPHNGAVITILVVCKLTHKEAYLDFFVAAVVIQIIALVALILMASLFGTF